MDEVEASQGKTAALPPGPKPIAWEAVLPNPKLKLLDQVREVLRLRHYSIRTEQSYCDWIRRFVRFHRMHSREELLPGEPKIEAFLCTHCFGPALG